MKVNLCGKLFPNEIGNSYSNKVGLIFVFIMNTLSFVRGAIHTFAPGQIYMNRQIDVYINVILSSYFIIYD